MFMIREFTVNKTKTNKKGSQILPKTGGISAGQEF